MKSQRLRNILMVAALALVAATSMPAASADAGPNWLSDDEIAAEAARQFAEMKASMPLITDRATIDYIACVANAVVQVLEPEYRDLPWEMAIFDDDSVNAFAMPGGKIGVMQGILKAAQNQDQLAAGGRLQHAWQRRGLTASRLAGRLGRRLLAAPGRRLTLTWETC